MIENATKENNMWYDNLDNSKIELMKNNVMSHRMLKIMDPDFAELFERVPTIDLVYLNFAGNWAIADGHSLSYQDEETYRLRYEWRRPLRWEGEVELRSWDDPGLNFQNDELYKAIQNWPEGAYKLTMEEL